MKPEHKKLIPIAIALLIGFFLGMEYRDYQLRSAIFGGFSQMSEMFGDFDY